MLKNLLDVLTVHLVQSVSPLFHLIRTKLNLIVITRDYTRQKG